MTLKRNISPISLLCAAIGGILGSGWLLGPFYAAQISGPYAILAWVIGGVLMMFIALTFAELATMFPVAGGTARFIQFSHGALASFTLSWAAWVASIVVAPIETMALLKYADNYIPYFVNNQTHMLSATGVLAAGLIMLFICFLNAVGANVVARFNNFIVILKIFVPALVIIALFSFDFHWGNFSADVPSKLDGLKGVLTALPLAGVIFSFIGYSPAIQLAGESSNPQKAIPLAIIGSLILGILLYVIIQTAFIGAIDPRDIAAGWHHLTFPGDQGVFAGLMTKAGLVWIAVIIYIGAAISPFGTSLIYTTATARMNYAISQNGFMPKFFTKLNKHGVPVNAIFTNFCLGMLLFLPFPSWQKMVGFLVAAFVFAYAVGPLALIALRKKLPDQHRPFKVPCATIMSFIAFYVCNLIIYWSGWEIVSHMVVALFVGYILLYIWRQMKIVEKKKLDWKSSWWIFV